MKKIYLATAALALFATTAYAQEYPRDRDSMHMRRAPVTRADPTFAPGTTTGMGRGYGYGYATGTEAGNNADSLYGSNSAVGPNPDTAIGQTSGGGAAGSAGSGQ